MLADEWFFSCVSGVVGRQCHSRLGGVGTLPNLALVCVPCESSDLAVGEIICGIPCRYTLCARCGSFCVFLICCLWRTRNCKARSGNRIGLYVFACASLSRVLWGICYYIVGTGVASPPYGTSHVFSVFLLLWYRICSACICTAFLLCICVCKPSACMSERNVCHTCCIYVVMCLSLCTARWSGLSDP
jgi:hypothetical protein